MNRGICLVAAVAISLAALTAPALADKAKKMNKTDLPPAVLVTFESTYPKASIKSIAREVKDSVIFYEIESKDGSTNRNLLYTPNGVVSEIEEEIGVKAVPDTVTDAIHAMNPKNKILKAERVTRGKTVEYELLVQAGEQQTEYVLDVHGATISSEVMTKKSGSGDDDEETDDDGE